MAQFDSMAIPPRLPLVVKTSNRNSSVSKDARLVNCYTEVDDAGELWIYKRPGLNTATLVNNGQPGHGVFRWRGSVYSIFDDKLYRDNVEVASGLNTAGGIYRFDEMLGAVPTMILGNGVQAYSYNPTDGLSAPLNSIDSDFPIQFVKGWAYLNGPIYVSTAAAVIWGSKPNSVDQPDDWDPLNFINAQIEPDDGVALNKQLVYVVAFNQWSTEIFFDAGNPTGSPLASVQGSKQSYGCANADSVQRIDDMLFWLCINQTSSLQVAMMAQLSTKIISTPAIDKLLEGADITGTDVVMSWQLKMGGHSWYIITLKNINLTLAYDISTDDWFQWTDSSGNYFPIISSTYGDNAEHILQHESNGNLYTISPNFFSDLDTPIITDIITPPFDANTVRRKQMNMLSFITSQVPGSVLRVRRTDNDYQSWSPWRDVDLSVKKPHLPSGGTFIKRAYQFRHEKDCFFRIQAVDVQYDIGTL